MPCDRFWCSPVTAAVKRPLSRGMGSRMLLPASATADARRLVAARALRGFADGFVSVYLAVYLQLLGLSAVQVGAIVTATLLGSAALTLAVGLVAHRLSPRRVLLGATLLMLATGIGFAVGQRLLAAAPRRLRRHPQPELRRRQRVPADRAGGAGVGGRRRPSAPTCSRATPSAARCSARSARWRAALPELAATHLGWPLVDAFRAGFVALRRRRDSSSAPSTSACATAARRQAGGTAGAPLRRSRAIVLRLTALFALDSFGGGFAVDADARALAVPALRAAAADGGHRLLRGAHPLRLLPARLAAPRRAHRARSRRWSSPTSRPTCS